MRKIERFPLPYAHSLAWFGEGLLDGLGGPKYYGLDGSVSDNGTSFAYRFDRTVVSPSGRYIAVLESRGTKALLLEAPGKLLRELNRSYFCADRYDYPLTFLTLSDGREALLHCPDEYNRLEIEDCATGERLTASAVRDPKDIFHSRLTVSPDGTRFFSAGWVWHPFDILPVYSIADALRDPCHLDSNDSVPGHDSLTAVWRDNQTILVGQAPEESGQAVLEEYHVEGTALSLTRTFPLDEAPGILLPIDDEHLVGFFDCPKLFHLPTGKVRERWSEWSVGRAHSGIGEQPAAHLAVDTANKRFALAHDGELIVVTLG